MTTIELNPEEREVLSQVLQNSLALLDVEIHHTDNKDFKHLLKHRREVLATLTDRVASVACVGA